MEVSSVGESSFSDWVFKGIYGMVGLLFKSLKVNLIVGKPTIIPITYVYAPARLLWTPPHPTPSSLLWQVASSSWLLLHPPCALKGPARAAT